MKKLILTLAVAALSFAAAKANPPGDCATCSTGGRHGWHGGGRWPWRHFHKYDRFTGWFHGGAHAV